MRQVEILSHRLQDRSNQTRTSSGFFQCQHFPRNTALKSLNRQKHERLPSSLALTWVYVGAIFPGRDGRFDSQPKRLELDIWTPWRGRRERAAKPLP
jgi:hypothetical protein